MLVTRFENAARFIGRLDQGQDIAAGFKIICRENTIRSAWICAAAALKNPVIGTVGTAGIGQPAMIDGTFLFASITGNASISGDETSVRLYGQGTSTSGAETISGVLMGGEVVFCEFMVTTCEEATLVREINSPFNPWVQLQPTGNAIIDDFQPSPARPTTIQPTSAVGDEEASELNILEMKAGDYVDHPRFGICRISAEPSDERISIRLATGKQVDLSLGVMKVHDPKQLGGRRVFKLEIRRR